MCRSVVYGAVPLGSRRNCRSVPATSIRWWMSCASENCSSNMSSSPYTALLLKMLDVPESRGWLADEEGYRVISNPWAMLFAAFIFHSTATTIRSTSSIFLAARRGQGASAFVAIYTIGQRARVRRRFLAERVPREADRSSSCRQAQARQSGSGSRAASRGLRSCSYRPRMRVLCSSALPVNNLSLTRSSATTAIRSS